MSSSVTLVESESTSTLSIPMLLSYSKSFVEKWGKLCAADSLVIAEGNLSTRTVC